MKKLQYLENLSFEGQVLEHPVKGWRTRSATFFGGLLVLSFMIIVTWTLIMRMPSGPLPWVMAAGIILLMASLLPSILYSMLDTVNPILAMELHKGEPRYRKSKWIGHSELATAMARPNCVLICIPWRWGKARVLDRTVVSAWPAVWKERMRVNRSNGYGLLKVQLSVEDTWGNTLWMNYDTLHNELMREYSAMGHMMYLTVIHKELVDTERQRAEACRDLASCKETLKNSASNDAFADAEERWVKQISYLLKQVQSGSRFKTSVEARWTAIRLMRMLRPHMSIEVAEAYQTKIDQLTAKVGEPFATASKPAA